MSKASEWAALAEKVEKVISGIERPMFMTANQCRGAWVTNIGGRAFLDINGNGRFSILEAQDLARWILDTFGENDARPA